MGKSVHRPVGRRGERRGEQGASAVEFAIILPLLVLFLFGIVEYGLIFFVNNGMTEATSDAARASLAGYTTGGTDAQIVQSALSYLSADLSNDSSGMIPGTSSCTSDDTPVTTGGSVTAYTDSASSPTVPAPSAADPVICAATISQPGTGGCNAPSGFECLKVVAEYGWQADPVIGLPLLPTPATLTTSSSVLVP